MLTRYQTVLILIDDLVGHDTRVSCLSFHPEATVSLPTNALSMVTCGQDGAVKLWNLERLGDTHATVLSNTTDLIRIQTFKLLILIFFFIDFSEHVYKVITIM